MCRGGGGYAAGCMFYGVLLRLRHIQRSGTAVYNILYIYRCGKWLKVDRPWQNSDDKQMGQLYQSRVISDISDILLYFSVGNCHILVFSS